MSRNRVVKMRPGTDRNVWSISQVRDDVNCSSSVCYGILGLGSIPRRCDNHPVMMFTSLKSLEVLCFPQPLFLLPLRLFEHFLPHTATAQTLTAINNFMLSLSFRTGMPQS
ncbi:hypothetical protein HBH97_112890 [Parastagonospora nodorum]|nr:hypothetical protein HBH97_112890 [Parastagonospora nodorum]